MILATAGSDATEAKMRVGVARSDESLNWLRDKVESDLSEELVTLKWLHQNSQLEGKGKTLQSWASRVSMAVKRAANYAVLNAGRSDILLQDRASHSTSRTTWNDSLLLGLLRDSTGDLILGDDSFVLTTKPIRLWPDVVPSKSWNINGGHFPPVYTRVPYKLVVPRNQTTQYFGVTNHSASTLDKMTKDNLDEVGGSSSHRPFRDLWHTLIRTGDPQIVSFVMADLWKKERESLAGVSGGLNLQVADTDGGYTVRSGSVERYHDDSADAE
ncbi:hypothetical protein JCM24511_05433 [Saitozyma sp. JCM 24511]|nr:hypothetical protein JCM24511_05433 [Saitozyma sp. JCM 24511]